MDFFGLFWYNQQGTIKAVIKTVIKAGIKAVIKAACTLWGAKN